MEKTCYVGCLKGDGKVYTDREGVITETMPVFKRFIGQPLIALERWAQAMGGFSKACK